MQDLFTPTKYCDGPGAPVAGVSRSGLFTVDTRTGGGVGTQKSYRSVSGLCVGGGGGGGEVVAGACDGTVRCYSNDILDPGRPLRAKTTLVGYSQRVNVDVECKDENLLCSVIVTTSQEY